MKYKNSWNLNMLYNSINDIPYIKTKVPYNFSMGMMTQFCTTQSNKNSLLCELKIKVLECVKNSHNILLLQESKGLKARDCDNFSTNILVYFKIMAKTPTKIPFFEYLLNSQLILKWSRELNNIGRSNTVKEYLYIYIL